MLTVPLSLSLHLHKVCGRPFSACDDSEDESPWEFRTLFISPPPPRWEVAEPDLEASLS